MNIAIITTVHNRKEKTIRAINSICSNSKYKDVYFYICDDNSTDGTTEILQKKYSNLKVCTGTGFLFWSKGMYEAMKLARNDDPDLYLMINDDVEFYGTALEIMITSYFMAGKKCGIVGSTWSNNLKKISYGGRQLNNQHLIEPNGALQKCSLTNWNCFLVDRYVVEKIGLIDNYYEHGLGDFDYSLQMNKEKIPIYVATDYVGICETNTLNGTYHDKSLRKKLRFKSMLSKRNMPVKSRWHYYWKNFGIRGLKSFAWPYIKCSLYIILGKDY